MYFWRIEKLKKSMATAPLTDREVLPYLIASLVLITAIIGLSAHIPNPSIWDDAFAIFNTVITIIGTIYIYKRNNGAQSQHFLQRYIVIGWVVGLRWVTAYLLILIPLFIVLERTTPTEVHLALAAFVFDTIAAIILYWRIGHHVHDLAQKSMTQEKI